MVLKDDVKINNIKGQYHCPVLYRQFTESSHIVAISTTGNVFSYEVKIKLKIKKKKGNYRVEY